ncbi:MAG: carboxypeptidase regulatory-like domain-containing protein [Pyrinomonadaceae bacterium]
MTICSIKGVSNGFILLLAFAVFSVGAFAQSGTSTINGDITDQNGASVPGATVKIDDPTTGFSRTTTTNNAGRYSFPGIIPGQYNVSVEASNFKKSLSNGVFARIDSVTVLNFSLEPGDVSAVVDVTSESIESAINTTDARLGNNFQPEQIINLPTSLRRVNDLMSLQPGVTREGYVAGGRSDQSNITLDGVDINDQQDGGRDGQFSTSQGSVLRATTESVEEFRITTANANANQGRSSGAQISLITRSGTNEWKGSLFYFYRPTQFSANSFFNNLSDTARPSLARDLFGGRFGGPIVKDKAFFFYSYEGQRQQLEESVTRTVPLAHLGKGEIHFTGTGPSCVNGQCVVGLAELNSSIFPSVGINPIAMSALADAAAKYRSNYDDYGDGFNTGGYTFNSPRNIKENTHTAKFDFNLTDNQQLFARGTWQWDIVGGTSQFPDTPSTNRWDHPWGIAVGHNWTINSNMINNIRYGWTHQSFSSQGDADGPQIYFRFVFEPLKFSRTLSRVTDTHNLTDDFTWIKGNHMIQMGGNLRLIENKRNSYSNAYDDAVTNPSFYESSGGVISDAFTDAGYSISGGSIASVEAAATALIGRLSQYSGNFTFDLDGNVVAAGTPTQRTFATQEGDMYFQDQWRVRRNLTVTAGLRYGLSRPVYEKNGYQVVPDTPLGDYFDARVASAANGIPYNELIQFVKGGPANNGPGFYEMDKNNFQPRVAFAWSPSFETGFLNKLFGGEGESTFRGGFSMVNDYFGQQLAVSFDGLSVIGFTSSNTISANTYNVTDTPAPLFTGWNMDIRSLPGIPAPVQRFDTPADEAQRIEVSLDATIQSPQHYMWNFSYGRSLPGGMYLEAGYVGRAARNLFATRDVLAFNNLVDPVSGMDWYTAAGLLAEARMNDVPFGSVPVIPYFENLFPTFRRRGSANATNGIYSYVSRDQSDILDWTYIQALIDDRGIYPNMFIQPQYAAFSAYGTTAYSNYHGGTLTVRQRLGTTLTWDFNYTFSKSLDNASGLQTGGSYGSQFILNALRPDDNYSYSDFDIRHSINANFIFQLPFGKGAMFDGQGMTKNFFLGGWQLSGIYRFNTGLPLNPPFDQAQWATNWNAQSNGTQLVPVTVGANRNTQNAFTDPQAAFNSYRNALPGETGQRNIYRIPNYQTLDLGLTKDFRFPWNENHLLQIRWEVFNVPNFQPFSDGGQSRSTWGLPQDPELSTASANFGKIYNSIQGNPRSMQFGIRYEF